MAVLVSVGVGIGHEVLLVLLDLSAASNTIDHNLLTPGIYRLWKPPSPGPTPGIYREALKSILAL